MCAKLNLSWRRWSLSYRNSSIDLLCNSMDRSLYDRDLRHERVKNNNPTTTSTDVVLMPLLPLKHVKHTDLMALFSNLSRTSSVAPFFLKHTYQSTFTCSKLTMQIPKNMYEISSKLTTMTLERRRWINKWCLGQHLLLQSHQ